MTSGQPISLFLPTGIGSKPWLRLSRRPAFSLVCWPQPCCWRLACRSAYLTRALELSESLIKESRANHRTVGEFAQCCLLAGRLAQARGQPAEAARHWQRALEVLTPRLPGSRDWRLLDPAAQSLVLLGRPDEARPWIEQLRRSGYHPLDPRAAETLGLPRPAPISPPSSSLQP
jgi:tetratricopeptide (TPR) repeat protein